MKLEARSRLQAYSIIEPFSKMDAEGGGRDFLNKQNARLIKNAIPNSSYEVYANEFEDRIELHVLQADRYLGMVMFTQDPYDQKRYRPLKDMHCVVPHIDFSKELQGTGIATQLYALAIRRGLTLFTPGHTPKAASLWDRVAKLPGINNYYVNLYGAITLEDTKFSVRVLTKHTLKLRP